MFNLVKDGIPTDTLRDEPGDPNPVKGFEWFSYRVETPVYDPATQKLGPPEKNIVGGEVVQIRPVIDKTQAELEAEKRIVTYGDFEARFTVLEFDAATAFVYAADPSTGAPLRPKLIRGLTRAIARNSVDLLDPSTVFFLDALVSGGVINEARKAEILAL